MCHTCYIISAAEYINIRFVRYCCHELERLLFSVDFLFIILQTTPLVQHRNYFICYVLSSMFIHPSLKFLVEAVYDFASWIGISSMFIGPREAHVCCVCWKFIGGRPLCNLRFADYIDILGGREEHLQQLAEKNRRQHCCMEISSDKSKILINSIKSRQSTGIRMHGEVLEEVDSSNTWDRHKSGMEHH